VTARLNWNTCCLLCTVTHCINRFLHTNVMWSGDWILRSILLFFVKESCVNSCLQSWSRVELHRFNCSEWEMKSNLKAFMKLLSEKAIFVTLVCFVILLSCNADWSSLEGICSVSDNFKDLYDWKCKNLPFESPKLYKSCEDASTNNHDVQSCRESPWLFVTHGKPLLSIIPYSSSPYPKVTNLTRRGIESGSLSHTADPLTHYVIIALFISGFYWGQVQDPVPPTAAHLLVKPD
jgi:hypothetical protein